jgi:hypothetical protein
MSEQGQDGAEVTDERILADLTAYQEAGMIDYVLPTGPLGEAWIVGWQGRILKFTTKGEVCGFLTGIQVAALFVSRMRDDPLRQCDHYADEVTDDAMVGCPSCDGTGQSLVRGAAMRGYDEPDYWGTCGICGGGGYLPASMFEAAADG